VTIAGTGTFALQEQTGGTASATNVVATGVAQANEGNAPSYSCEGTSFTITDNGGNSGISPTQCNGTSPAPVYPPYPASGVTATPSALNFGSAATGTTSSAQTVTVSNPTGSAAAVSSIATSGDFAQTSTCGSSIAANGSCTVSVTFTPTAAGTRTGSLTINAGGVTNTVSLTGTGTAPGPALNASPADLSFAGTVVGSTSGTQTETITNSGTASATVSGVSVTGDFSQTSNCTSIAVNGSCTVTVSFKPTAGGTRTGTLTVTSNATNSPTTVSLTGNGISSTTNIALNQPITSSSNQSSAYTAAMANDGNTSTYWEGADGSGYPQTLTVNLGSAFSLGSIVLDLPPSAAWNTRTQTLSVLGSANGSAFTTIVGSAGYTFNPATGNTVTINLPSGTSAQYVRLSFTANTGWSAAQVAEFEVFTGAGGSPGPVNLALNQPATASGYTQAYVPANAVDGNTSSYWESTDSAFPQWLQVDLGSAQSFSRIVLDLPPSSAWATRTQTLNILGSNDGSTFTTIVASAGYTFNPSTGNTVTITFPSASYRYVRLNFTANTGWPAGQVSEFQIWPS
jgi:hypothetical protein